LGELARELAPAVSDDKSAPAGFFMLRNVDFAGQHDDNAGAYLPDLKDCLTRLVHAYLAEPPHAVHIFGVQHRKHLVASRINDFAREKSH
jgi:hypothetical protein